MKMYDTIKNLALTDTPEAIRKEFETAMKKWEIERKNAAVADARTKYASQLTEIANRMLNHTETAEDAAFILNTYITDKLGQQDNNEFYITAKEMNSIIECMSALKEFGEAFTNDDDDATISKFLNKLGL